MINILAGLSILIIGDSHLATPDYLITTLHDNLTKQGQEVHTLGVCGVTAESWTKSVSGNCGGAERVGKGPVKLVSGSAAKTAPINTLIEKEHPSLVIVVLGDTMGAYKDDDFPKNWVWQQVTQLTGAISKTGTACAWVGPAWGTEGGKFGKTFARAKVLSSFLSKNVAPCTYIDSLTLSKPGQWSTIDGQHFTSSGYKAWGDGIADAVMKIPAVKK
jgi:hypothetical protein